MHGSVGRFKGYFSAVLIFCGASELDLAKSFITAAEVMMRQGVDGKRMNHCIILQRHNHAEMKGC